MSKKWFWAAVIPVLCISAKPNDDWKQLDITKFTISVPKKWKFTLMQGEETFAGVIRTQKTFLAFNYKDNGLGNDLPLVEDENFKTDSTDKFIIKTIWPKTVANGITGINIKDRSSDADLIITGINLNEKEQAEALQAFKTIELKK